MKMETSHLTMKTENASHVSRGHLSTEQEKEMNASVPFLFPREENPDIFHTQTEAFETIGKANPEEKSLSHSLPPVIERNIGPDSWLLEWKSRRKVNSARKILRDLNRYYLSLFREPDDAVNGKYIEKQLFLNSGLLYLIEVTDGNEDTLGHSQLVASYTLMLAKALGIGNKAYLLDLERGAMLHDIGKIGIPESILRKPGALTVVEKEVVKEHPLIGYELLEEFQFLKKPAQIVIYHHESYDGSGYPYNLAGDEIPLEARIFALADTLDAITSDRPYRKAAGFEEARLEIEKGRGSQFDSQIVDAFFSVPLTKWQQIKARTEEFFQLNTVH
jgi:putative nucleotidyltransferase with HDIG domain